MKRFLNSPTLMTWMSYSTKALALFGILPLVLKLFSPGDIVLWYLFATIITMQSLADFGFRQTFSRIISYAFKGVSEIVVYTGKNNTTVQSDGEPNLPLLNDIVANMKYIYLRLTLIIFVIMSVAGTWVMYKPTQQASNITEAWYSWAIVLVVSCISFYGRLYMNFLEGLFKIALVRRVETLTSLGSIICSILVLLFAPTLLNLILVNQLWVLVVTYRDYYLCKTTDNGFYLKVAKPLSFNKTLFSKIWPPAWRSGISGLMSIGLTNATGIIYAQVGSTADVAAYLLALRIISQIRDISMAPFYSKLPLLAMLRAKNDLLTLIKTVKRGMLLSHSVFLIGVITIGIFSNSFLHIIGSDVQFVTPMLWALLSLAFFAHRFGAMHIQVYLSTNHVISHIADGVSGIIYISVSLLLVSSMGIYAIPVGMLAGYLGFYAWYAAKNSYQSMNVNFWDFEKNTTFLPFTIAITYFIISLCFK